MADPAGAHRGQPSASVPAAPRLRFRTWSSDDFPLALRLWGDPAVMRYLHRAPYTEEQVRGRLEREASNLATLGYQYWPLIEAGSGAFAGCAGLKPCPDEGSADEPELELGFHLLPSMWGRGFATEAASAVAAWAFDVLGVQRVYAGHHPENTASGNVLRKLGFRFRRNVYFEPTGLMHPLYVLEAASFTGRAAQ